jgi:hypothetical protein
VSKSISQILADLGVSHMPTGSNYHALYFAGRFIGYYHAHEVGALIREYLPEEA